MENRERQQEPERTIIEDAGIMLACMERLLKYLPEKKMKEFAKSKYHSLFWKLYEELKAGEVKIELWSRPVQEKN